MDGWRHKMDILKEALENYEEGIAYEFENRQDFLLSNNFVDGKQWEETEMARRIAAKRPCLTTNKLRKYIFQILGEIQQSRLDLKTVPLNQEASTIIAIIIDKLIKDIERKSNSNYSYDRAIQCALQGGWGYWRIFSQYISKYSFDQEIVISSIQNPLSVILDPYMKSNTGKGAEWGLIVTTVPLNKFKKKYNKALPGNFEMLYGMDRTGWYTKDSVRLAEYYYKEYEKENLLLLTNGSSVLESKFEEKRDFFFLNNIGVENYKVIYNPRVKWIKMSKDNIIEGPFDVPGDEIPIVKVCGYEHNDQGYTRYRSLVHDALDPMRIFNHWRTHIVELISLAPKAPYLVTPDQIKGFEEMWKKANVELYPFLFYNAVPNATKPEKESAFQIQAAAITEANMAAADIQDVIGMYAASIGEPSNERSGRAILARQAQANNTVFQFINNFQSALIHSGNILIKMIPTIYKQNRIVRIIGEEGIEDLQLNYKNINIQNLLSKIENDITLGEYEITSTTGPYYATRRQQTAASMLDFIQFAPQMAPIVLPKLAKLLDWEGASNISKELETLTQQMELSGSKQKTGNTSTRELA